MIYQNYKLLILFILAVTALVAVEYSKPVTQELVIVEVPVIFVIEKEPEVKPVVAPKPEPKPEVKKEVSKLDANTYLLAQIINAEAKGESYNGKVAVGNVILNRVNNPQFPDTIKDVIFQRGQFSPVSDGSINNKPSEESIKAAKDAISGYKVVGDQALYFYNPDTSTSNWIFSRQTLMEIGNHRFAK